MLKRREKSVEHTENGFEGGTGMIFESFCSQKDSDEDYIIFSGEETEYKL